MKSVCICCKSNEVIQLLDLKMQPPSNRYLYKGDSASDKHPLSFGVCDTCGHMQLIDPMNVDMVRSHFDWISYNEPEGHLDEVVLNSIGLPGLTSNSSVIGISYKDDTVLDRLRNHGFDNTYRLKPESDLAIPDDSGLEVIQSSITPDIIQHISTNSGQADLVFARHILEHSHNPDKFIQALKSLVRDGGYLVFEVPDSEKFMRNLDYPFIWEEHISYFVEKSLKQFIEKQNLRLISLYRYEYTFEDSLVVITQDKKELQDIPSDIAEHKYIMNLAYNYAQKYPSIKRSVREKLMVYVNSGKRIGLFGAGHLATKYLNFFELADIVEMILDDNPNKQGLHMPGSGLPIVGSSCLDQIDLCLLALSPESEEKVFEKYNYFTENGGDFRSIFAASPIAL